MTFWLWMAILAGSVLFGVYRHHVRQSRVRRKRILEAVLNRDGPEAAKAMEARLKGEWQ